MYNWTLKNKLPILKTILGVIRTKTLYAIICLNGDKVEQLVFLHKSSKIKIKAMCIFAKNDWVEQLVSFHKLSKIQTIFTSLIFVQLNCKTQTSYPDRSTASFFAFSTKNQNLSYIRISDICTMKLLKTNFLSWKLKKLSVQKTLYAIFCKRLTADIFFV